jgi:hypothetical protein
MDSQTKTVHVFSVLSDIAPHPLPFGLSREEDFEPQRSRFSKVSLQ